MPASPPPQYRSAFRFGLPPSLGSAEARGRADQLERFLATALGKSATVQVAASYDALSKDVLAGRVDAAWAPPFVCARIEAMAARTLCRGVRKGASTYRAALISRADRPLTFDGLKGTSAAWVDRDSVGGYLLTVAMLKGRGLDPAKTFFAQDFTGSYRAAIEAVLDGKSDVASIFAAAASTKDAPATGADELIPGANAKLKVLAYTEESPNDGVVVAPTADGSTVEALEEALLSLGSEPKGAQLLHDVFSVDRFETAPRMGYRALYRVAMASI